MAFGNHIYPFVCRSQECSLYHPSDGRQVRVRIIWSGMSLDPVFACTEVYRCTDICCSPGICSDLNCHISLAFFQLVYKFAQLTLWVMLWAWMEDGASGLLLERLHQRMKLSHFELILKLMHRILFLLSDIRCAGSPSGVSETINLMCKRGRSPGPSAQRWHNETYVIHLEFYCRHPKGSKKHFNGSAADVRAAISYLCSALWNRDPS